MTAFQHPQMWRGHIQIVETNMHNFQLFCENDLGGQLSLGRITVFPREGAIVRREIELHMFTKNSCKDGAENLK